MPGILKSTKKRKIKKSKPRPFLSQQTSAKARAKARPKPKPKSANSGSSSTAFNRNSNFGNEVNEYNQNELGNIQYEYPAGPGQIGSSDSLIKLFKNGETQLLENLLTGYNPDSRPVLNFNDAVQVNFSISLIRIIEMNTKSQELKTSIWLNYVWIDQFLKWKPENYAGVKRVMLPIDKIWKPDILLYNSVSENFDPSFRTNAVVNHDGMVNWLPPAMVTSSCKVDVQYYPFDHQDCPFIFGPWSHNMMLLNVTLTSPSADIQMYEQSNTWDLLSMDAERQEVAFESTPNDPPFVYITYFLRIKRYKKYGILNFIIPCLICCGIALMVFILPSDAGEKIGLSITVLLALIVFMQMLAAETPPTTDDKPTPVIQKCFLYTMVMVMFSTIATVLQLFMHHRDVGIQDPVLPDPLRYLFVKFLPKFLFLRPFEGNNTENLKWFNNNLPFIRSLSNNGIEKINSDDEGDNFVGGRDKSNAQGLPNDADELLFITQSQDSNVSEISESGKETLKILDELKKLTGFLAEEELKNEGGDEWKYCAI